MFVTPEAKRAGLLVAVISGGRPKLSERSTAKFLRDLDAFGPADIVWVVNETDAETYEDDPGHPLCVYTHDWAREYARDHWTLPTPPADFVGAFPGREWACREAERRGCWGVLQIDDNIVQLSVIRGGGAAARYCSRNGGLALHADLLSAAALSTNSWMTGAQLQSAMKDRALIARTGFPYSCFIERVGEGREEWVGPFEDDITHAFQYGSRADGATTALLMAVRYMKARKTGGGMRNNYDHTRSVALQRMFPQSAKVTIMAKRSNGRGEPRVFHKMAGAAIRNPLRITDRDLYGQLKERIETIMVEWHAEDQESTRRKIAKRVAGTQPS